MSGTFSRKLLCGAVASACAGAVLAGPAGPVVSAGSATYAPATLTVTSTTARTQISWQSFNVATNEVVNFVQPSAQSSVLNHIFNPQSLNILGSLSSNGSVLFMMNGIVSGSGMNLDLAGLVNTSLRLPQLALARSGVAQMARPLALTTLAEGRIYVISPDEQAVTTANGDVVLNPGKTVELANASMPSLRVELTAPHAEAINLSRLVGTKRGTGIFAGLFRVPAAARQAAEPDAGAVLTASAEQSTASNPDMERFFRYALLYAQMRSEALQNEGGMMKVAAAPGSRLVLPAAKSRPSLLPQAIEIGAPVERSREAAAALAAIAGPAAVEPVATLEPQPIPVAAESEPERNVAALLAFTPAPPAVEVVATLEPQPILVHQALEPEDIRTLARQLAVAQPLAQSAPAVIVVAMAQQSATPAREEASNVKEVRIERRAPRFFTDYRGAVFHM